MTPTPAVLARLTDAEPLTCAWCTDYKHPAETAVSHGMCDTCVTKMGAQADKRYAAPVVPQNLMAKK